MKFPLVGAQLFRVDGQTDMTKLLVAFRNFVNAPKNWKNLNFLVTNQMTLKFLKPDIYLNNTEIFKFLPRKPKFLHYKNIRLMLSG
jgi:hypothetical protein